MDNISPMKDKMMRYGKFALAGVTAALLLGSAYYMVAGAADDKTGAKTADSMTSAESNASPELAGDAGKILAVVDGENITNADVSAFVDKLPPQMRQLPLNIITPMVVNELIDSKLVSKAASAENLANDPEVLKLLETAKARIIQQIYLERHAEAAITEAELKKAYDDFVAKNPPQDEVKARHILVKSEDEAKAIIKQLEEGADFGKLAAEKSVDPSAKTNAGDLGYFSRSQMVEPFADAAFGLSPGMRTKAPVKTDFGWHVIEVQDRRSQKLPSIDEMTPQLKADLQQNLIGKKLEELRQNAKIEMKIETSNPAANDPNQAVPNDGKTE